MNHKIERVFMAHCRYRHRGGEDLVFEQEAEMLHEAGIQVERLECDNHELRDITAIDKITAGLNTLWSWSGAKKVAHVLEAFKPDLVHFHNTFPQLSPSAWHECRKAGVPVIQTLHNYRLLCAAATFTRDGAVCEDCKPRRFHHAVRYGCYRGSRTASLAVTAMQYVHHLGGTYRNKVDRYIALTEFARDKFIEGGLPAERISVKPNFIPDPVSSEEELRQERAGALFVGRLSPEKGIECLLRAWSRLELPLTVIGDGPLFESLPRSSQVRFLGRRPRDEIAGWMRRSAFLVMPSLCYEGLPMTLIEAYANGLPVLASRLGSLAELVREGVTGLCFRAGDEEDLRRVVKHACSGGFDLVAASRAARAEYLRKYTPQRNLEQLLSIYRSVIR